MQEKENREEKLKEIKMKKSFFFLDIYSFCNIVVFYLMNTKPIPSPYPTQLLTTEPSLIGSYIIFTYYFKKILFILTHQYKDEII